MGVGGGERASEFVTYHITATERRVSTINRIRFSLLHLLPFIFCVYSVQH